MRLIAILLSLFLGACGAERASVSIPNETSPSIIGGKKLNVGEAISSSVVAIFDEQKQFLCTGTLISESVVLTAAHCILSKPQKVKVVFGTDAFSTLNAREVDVKEQFVRRAVAMKTHDSYEQDEEKQPELDQNDIALIKFAGALPEGFRPAPLLKDEKALDRGVEATVAGYGVRKVDISPIDIKGESEKELMERVISGEIACDENFKQCFEVLMSDDGELYSAVAPIKGFTESEVRLDESKGQGTCSGDSGGPAFIMKDGAYHVFGVTSRGNMLCDFEGVYTNVLEHSAWIEQTLKEL